MAGSQPQSHSLPFADPVLAARVEALRLLADRVSERLMVLDRDLTILYANRLAMSGAGCYGTAARPSKCYEAILHRPDPCGACTATKAFEPDEVQSVSGSTVGDGNTCGMIQAFPLMPSRGPAASVLVLFKGAERGNGTAGAGSGEAGPNAAAAPGESHLGNLIGRSKAMRQLFEMIRLVADSQATVLLQGESGTGKELVARTIHNLSVRRDQPFVVVDCGSLPATLLESELFGHVKGAFTGAVSAKKGLFEEANGGTLFLDEVADTGAHFQSKLLRALQEGEVKPVGSSRSIKVNVRVISATNKDLTELTKTKVFREDLYYRLAVLPLVLPPLRERRDDIPLLIRYFMETASLRNGKPTREVTPDAVQALMDAAWPGNVRELQHMIERVVVTTPGPQLTLKDFFGAEAVSPAASGLRNAAKIAVEFAERARIIEALNVAGGKRARAARILKISRANLYNKLRAYKIG
jgi:two-component system response regulator AtoC